MRAGCILTGFPDGPFSLKQNFLLPDVKPLASATNNKQNKVRFP